MSKDNLEIGKRRHLFGPRNECAAPSSKRLYVKGLPVRQFYSIIDILRALSSKDHARLFSTTLSKVVTHGCKTWFADENEGKCANAVGEQWSGGCLKCLFVIKLAIKLSTGKVALRMLSKP